MQYMLHRWFCNEPKIELFDYFHLCPAGGCIVDKKLNIVTEIELLVVKNADKEKKLVQQWRRTNLNQQVFGDIVPDK